MTEHLRSPAKLTDLHVVAAVIFRQGKIMAARRLAGGPSSLKWEFPGGKVEEGELPESALMREIDEELGMAITIQESLGLYVTDLGKWRLHLRCFLCHTADTPRRMEAHSEIRWCSSQELDELDWAIPDRPAVDALRARTRWTLSGESQEQPSQ